MVNFVTKKQAGTGLSVLDALGISAAKSLFVDGFATGMLNKVTRGNPIFNGLGKVLGAGLTGSVLKNRVGGIIATSMVVSAGDDFFKPIVAALNGGTAGQNASTSRAPAGADTFGQANVGSIKMRPI